MTSSAPDRTFSVLVVGGCGFVGFHVARHFSLHPTVDTVSVISRNPDTNRLPQVSYYAGDISDLEPLRTLIHQISPSVIVHAASPLAISATAADFERVTIQGTKNLLTVASEVPSVEAFMFTSSATMAAGPEHISLDETTRLADTVANSNMYAKTKAQADKMVLEANRRPSSANPSKSSQLRTACLRLPVVYGERDMISIPGCLAAIEEGRTKVQFGDGSNLWDFVSADNVAIAHMLAAQALLTGKISDRPGAGEAFNITDGERHYFWDFPRAVWKAAGHEVKPEDVWKIPATLALIVADVLEWLFWIFTFGTKRPQQLGRQQVEYLCLTHTYSIQKARERLGYHPESDFNDGIRRAVAWSLDAGGWRSRLSKDT
ncbi:MAG: hypothetical protein L6R39_000337 [Caloplaca ligustica]|nr:MAG: hypothetical protein L6R39_000337 [Caloplaca ligustica]